MVPFAFGLFFKELKFQSETTVLEIWKELLSKCDVNVLLCKFKN